MVLNLKFTLLHILPRLTVYTVRPSVKFFALKVLTSIEFSHLRTHLAPTTFFCLYLIPFCQHAFHAYFRFPPPILRTYSQTSWITQISYCLEQLLFTSHYFLPFSSESSQSSLARTFACPSSAPLHCPKISAPYLSQFSHEFYQFFTIVELKKISHTSMKKLHDTTDSLKILLPIAGNREQWSILAPKLK